MKLKRGPMGASRDMECVYCRGETKAALKGGAAVAQKFECLGGRRRGRGDDSKGDGGPSGPIHGVALGHKASGRDRRGSALRRGGDGETEWDVGAGMGRNRIGKIHQRGRELRRGRQRPHRPRCPLSRQCRGARGRPVGKKEGPGAAPMWGGKWRPWKATGEFFHTRRGDGENLGLGVGAHAGLVAA
jgi:hypothetical protein